MYILHIFKALNNEEMSKLLGENGCIFTTYKWTEKVLTEK